MNSTVGLAYVGGMCSSKVSCTISEGTSFSASYIAAHEIGHSLSMPHDGDVGSWDCEGNKYLMSSVMSSGATTWSSCSKDALVGFLFSGKGSCLTSTKDFDEPRRGHAGKLPGKRFGASEQCRYMYGSDWDFFSSTESPFNNVCKEIWCRNGRKLRTPSASALEGTPCGPLKICKNSKCKRVAPRNKDKKKKVKENKKKKKKKKKKEGKEPKKIAKTNKKSKNIKKKDKSENKKVDFTELDLTKRKGKAKKKKKESDKKKKVKTEKNKNKKNKNKKKNKKNKPLTVSVGDRTTVKTKEKIRRKSKKPKKSWRIETPTHIIIKERVGYIEGKGWKIRVLRVKKTKIMMEEEGRSRFGNNKRHTKKKVKSCKGRDKTKCKRIRKKGKKAGRSLANTILKTSSSKRGRCQLQKVKQVKGKGWWVRLPLDCIVNQATG
ncbi:uncharacterized protein LOC122265750 isoform X1 [Penaeus japonicus]|uniref:uncharacterized protein LOC122265750 isoform X1 n=1 Tax=Penaeus japonicus TaxID=27405 RepID=UPI001C715B69|nr:uncharacterized protein LOC122265750 isoform X1 [Penaeus japonicus]